MMSEAFRHGVLGSVNDATKAGHNALSEAALRNRWRAKKLNVAVKKGALGDPKNADLKLGSECIEHGRFDWTFTTGQTLLEYVLSLPDDLKESKKSSPSTHWEWRGTGAFGCHFLRMLPSCSK